MLVSQDKRLKRQLRQSLAALGFPIRLTTMHSDHERAHALTKTPPDLIVVDDGALVDEALSLLDTFHHYAPHALVVYIAGQHTAELERTVRQRGVLYYTAKPPEDLLLQRVLASALERSLRTGKFAA